MPRERRKDMDVRSARAHGASPSLRYSDEGGTQSGARTLGYLVSFQVTRRRRNRSGVSRSVDNFITELPPRPNRGPYRRDLRRLPQELRQDGQLCSLLILILILPLSARQSRRHQSRLGCRLNAGDVEWAERHGCRESRPPPRPAPITDKYPKLNAQQQEKPPRTAIFTAANVPQPNMKLSSRHPNECDKPSHSLLKQPLTDSFQNGK
jgi:hypothetical protein